VLWWAVNLGVSVRGLAIRPMPSHGKLWKSLRHAHLGNYEELEVRLRKLASRSLAA